MANSLKKTKVKLDLLTEWYKRVSKVTGGIYTQNKFKTRSTAAVDPQHLKAKEQDISLTKNCYISINIKIISSIHIFNFKIQVLGSH